MKLKVIDNIFYYFIDISKTYYQKGQTIDNLMLDYSLILDKSINDYEKDINGLKNIELK